MIIRFQGGDWIFVVGSACRQADGETNQIKKSHEWFIKYRDPKKTGLVSILHPWESGYDNSSLWDGPMSKVKIEKNIQYKRADNKVVNPEHRPLNIDYDRYVTIKNDLRKKKYDPKKIFKTALFNVVDIGFNSIFLKANKDLIILLKIFNIDIKIFSLNGLF